VVAAAPFATNFGIVESLCNYLGNLFLFEFNPPLNKPVALPFFGS